MSPTVLGGSAPTARVPHGFEPPRRIGWLLRRLDHRREVLTQLALGLILDLNVRALSKGALEPYISAPLMEYAIAEGILMSPGDDSHGVEDVAANIIAGAEILVARGGRANWAKPVIKS